MHSFRGCLQKRFFWTFWEAPTKASLEDFLAVQTIFFNYTERRPHCKWFLWVLQELSKLLAQRLWRNHFLVKWTKKFLHSRTLPRILSQGLLFFEKKALLESFRNSVSNRVLRWLAHLVSRFACKTRVLKSL